MKPIVLRGFYKQTGEQRFVGVCLTLNLVVCAESMDAAKAKLETLIVAYVQDALQDGTMDTYVPRRAPLGFYAEYALGTVQQWLHAMRQPFSSFSETRQIPRHA